MKITEDTLLKDILIEYPWVKPVLINKIPMIKPLFGPLGKTILSKGTIADFSNISGKSCEWLISQLNKLINYNKNFPSN